MSDYASACMEQIKQLGFKAGTRLNIFCSSCLESLKVFSDKPNRVEIQKYLDNHREHKGCFFGFNDGRKWKIESDGGIASNESQQIEPTIETTTLKEPLSQSNPELGRGEDTISDPDSDIFEGDPFENETWIKLYRKLKENPIYKDSKSVHLFVHLLLSANHKSNRFIFNEKEITVKRGQLITGRKQLSSETGIGEKVIRNRLKLFEKLGMSASKKTNKFSIITLCNYKHYQESNYEKGPAKGPTVDLAVSTPQGAIKGPARGHKQECKNINPYVEGSTELRLATLLLEEIRKNKPNYKEPNLQAWARDIDLLLRRDNRSAESIERVIRWAQGDHGDGKGDWKGWSAVILSAGKLRGKFDELELRMQKKLSPPQVRGPKYEKVN